VFDLLAPVVIDAVDFVVRFWPSFLVAAAAWLLDRRGVRVPRFAAPRAVIAYAVVFALALAGAALSHALRGSPDLVFEDDYGYLLTADTFLHGRLTNPPHPLTPHLRALYTLHEPTYSSVHLPGNGAALALGRLIFGRAIVAMWLAAALAAVAILYALRGWIPGEWAFALGCLVAVHSTLMVWSNDFHGGALSACGGALVAGAAGRLRRESRTIHGAAFGAGAALMELTRPYEGLIVVAAFGVVVLAARRWRALAVAFAVVVVSTAALMTMNRAVTGNPLKLPYAAYNDRYLSAPNFLWQRAGAMPRYEVPEFERLYSQFRRYYFRIRQPRELPSLAYAETGAAVATAIPKMKATNSLWLLELVPFFAFLALAPRRRDAAVIAAVLAAALLSLLSITWFTQSHYAAPAAGAFAVALGIGYVWLDARAPWLARVAYAATIAACVAAFIAAPRYGISTRTRMTAALEHTPGPHVVLTAPECSGFVHNGAEIDRQRVVWARDLGDNGTLLRHYDDRNVWSLRCTGGFRLMRARPPLRAPRERAYERDPYAAAVAR
jgi:hypothetical protein